MITAVTRTSAETEAIGEAWGRAAQGGWVIGLTGELGAGKTQLVKGLARGLGILARVHSPTFTLVNEYQGGRWPLFHLDLYRLETPAQIIAAGLEEYLFCPGGVTVIEWIERWLNRDPEAADSASEPPYPRGLFRKVVIEVVSESERRINYEDFSP